jgi:hypothetical protein
MNESHDHDYEQQQQQGYTTPPPSPPPRYEAPGPAPGRKSPGVAAALSALLPGLGNVYVGYVQRGVLQGLTFAAAITVISAPGSGPLEPFLGIFIAFWWIFCMLDGHRRAGLYNLALQGGRVPEMPRDLELPGMGGGMASGVTLVVVGLLLFLHTRFEMDMEWLEEWWPLALVIFGGWLIHRARREKRA